MNRVMAISAMLAAGLLAATTAAAESRRGPSYNKDCSAYGRGGAKSCFVQDAVQYCGACKTHSLAVKSAAVADGDLRLKAAPPAPSSPMKSGNPAS